jgi:hypothetical protein
MLTDRRDELAHRRVQALNRLQRLLSELIPGQRKKDLSALQAKACWPRSGHGTLPGRPDIGWQPTSSPTSSRSMAS